MRIVITGGAGFLGSRLARALLARGSLTDARGERRPIQRLVLLDVVAPALSDPRVSTVTGDLADPALIERVVTPDTDAVFHLAAVVSGQAEAEFDVGMRVNVDATRTLLERCRSLARPPKFVFTSSLAVFGGSLPDPVPDDARLTPQTSYGAQKAIGEFLVYDMTRKGYIDGRSLRLPTITVRPGKPNKAASSFASGIIREPVAGVVSECPVPETTGVWILSPRRVVEAFIHAQELPSSAWPTTRVVNLPGITLSVREMNDAMGRVAGPESVARVKFVPDARINGIVKTWPVRFRTPRADAMGFRADPDFDSIVRDHIENGAVIPA